MNSSTRIVVLVLALVLLLSAGLWWWSSSDNTIEVENNGLVDTPPLDDEGELPPGVPDGWMLSRTAIGNLYAPSELGSAYVNATDWPPALNQDDAPYACTEAGDETDRAGGTNEVTINGREYCRTIVAEGAAGSVYRQYAYAFPREEGTAILTFSVRFPQCANYEEAEAAACEAAQGSFNPDALADQMVGTIEWI